MALNLELIKIVCSIIIILYGLIFMIKTKAIAKSIEKVKGVKKDPKREKKVFIWGLVFFIIGIVLLIWILI